ncbi:L-aspartate transporter [Serratia plymuthica]|uniref:L-aspartate transporter n=1 Tax=Serratia plymuthica TaxID=82996 RepID=A0A2X4UDD0_SERPL|nr:L-aspartate transporter [Serratia plymuthica]
MQNPQRTIPIALILSVILSTIIYVLLQVAFLGSIPSEMLNGGWAGISQQFSLPYRDIAITLAWVGWRSW